MRMIWEERNGVDERENESQGHSKRRPLDPLFLFLISLSIAPSLASTCLHLSSLASTCLHLSPLAFTCLHLSPLAFTCLHLPSLAFTCLHLPSLASFTCLYCYCLLHLSLLLFPPSLASTCLCYYFLPGTLSFALNGKDLGIAASGLTSRVPLYASFSLYNEDDQLSVVMSR